MTKNRRGFYVLIPNSETCFVSVDLILFFRYWRLLCAVQVEMKQTIEQNKKKPFHMVCGYQNCNDTAAEWHVLNIIQNHRAILN